MCPFEENVFMVLNHGKNDDCYKNPCLPLLTHKYCFEGKWIKKELFLQNQSINIIYDNKQNLFMVPNHEKSGDYYKNLCLPLFDG